MDGQAQRRILCVDDEPHVLDGLGRTLRRHFTVLTAVGGQAALAMIEAQGPFAVVVSDMRMPEMDGAAFLRRVRGLAPDSVRILLTGHADLDAAIAAVNEANIFRFLSKPCPPDVLLAAIEAAAEQYRLITAERVLLEQTLHGSIKTLTEILALASPAAFGRATRVKQYVSELATRLDLRDRGQAEVAAMLSQIGGVTLPSETADKLYRGQPLTPAERDMAGRLSAVAEQLLANIPRLEGVREIIRYQDKQFDGGGSPPDGVRSDRIPEGARLLKAVLDFDVLQTQGVTTGMALDTLRGRKGWYDPAVLEALRTVVGESGSTEVRELRLRDVRPGMTFAEDVVTARGLLLIARGQEVTPGLLERIRNFSEHAGVKEPLRMIVSTNANRERSSSDDKTHRAAG